MSKLIVDLVRLGPIQFFHNGIKLPVVAYIDSTLEGFRRKAQTGISNTKEVLVKGVVVSIITSILVWLSILMYSAFYYTYVPSIAHERPVHLQFTTSRYVDAESVSRDSFLFAHVELTKRQQLLMLGQPYRIHLQLVVPETAANMDLGMFMVCAEFYSKDKYKVKQLIAQSCRASMLHYRSQLVDTLYKLVFSPLLVCGLVEEKQHLDVELFSRYEEEDGPTATDVHIEIKSKTLQVYSAHFFIAAEFSGLRHFMFNWPVLAASIGITSNLLIIAVVSLVCWQQLVNSDEYKTYRSGKLNFQRRNDSAADMLPAKLEDDAYSSSSVEDISILEKYRERSSCESEAAIEDVDEQREKMM